MVGLLFPPRLTRVVTSLEAVYWGGGFRPRLAVPSEVALRPSGDTHTRGLVHADDL
jgi:hypothetical protein